MRPTRRELLVTGAGASVTSAALLRAGAADAVGPVSRVPETPAERLHRLLGVEQLLLFCYQHVLSASILKPRAREVLTPFLAHEESHVQALTRMLQSVGGSLPSAPPNIVTADRRLAHRGVSERLGQLTGSGDAVRLLLDVERVVTGAYFVALLKLQDTALIRLAAQIMGAEAQHEALIGELLNHGDAQQAVPYGLIQGTQ